MRNASAKTYWKRPSAVTHHDIPYRKDGRITRFRPGLSHATTLSSFTHRIIHLSSWLLPPPSAEHAQTASISFNGDAAHPDRTATCPLSFRRCRPTAQIVTNMSFNRNRTWFLGVLLYDESGEIGDGWLGWAGAAHRIGRNSAIRRGL